MFSCVACWTLVPKYLAVFVLDILLALYFVSRQTPPSCPVSEPISHSPNPIILLQLPRELIQVPGHFSIDHLFEFPARCSQGAPCGVSSRSHSHRQLLPSPPILDLFDLRPDGSPLEALQSAWFSGLARHQLLRGAQEYVGDCIASSPLQKFAYDELGVSSLRSSVSGFIIARLSVAFRREGICERSSVWEATKHPH